MPSQSNAHRIAVIAGDGIGKEVVPEGLRALEATAKRFNVPLASSSLISPPATITPSTAR